VFIVGLGDAVRPVRALEVAAILRFGKALITLGCVFLTGIHMLAIMRTHDRWM